MPPGVRPFTPVADSAKMDFVERLIRASKPDKGWLQTWVTDPAKNVGNMAKGLVLSAVATPIDAGDWAAQQVTKYVGGVEPKDRFDPATIGGTNLIGETWRGLNQASNRAAGDIAAIPGVGKPSASPTAADVRKYGVTEGLSRAGMDYGNLAAAAYPAGRAAFEAALPKLASEMARFRAGTDVGAITFGKGADEFVVTNDIVRNSGLPSVDEGSFRVATNAQLSSGKNPAPRVSYSLMRPTGTESPVVLLDSAALDATRQFGYPYVEAVAQYLAQKFPKARIVATGQPEWQRVIDRFAPTRYAPAQPQPVETALTYRQYAPLVNETPDEALARLAMGRQTFDQVTFGQPYAPEGTSIFVHRTTPDQAERLMLEGMQGSSPSWRGNMGASSFGEGVYPEGTIFASTMGSPTDEAFANAWRDFTGQPATATQVTLPRNAKVLEVNYDPAEGLTAQDLADSNVWDPTDTSGAEAMMRDFGLRSRQTRYPTDAVDEIDDIISAIGGNPRDPNVVKGALAQYAQRHGWDAVRVGDELMVVPKTRIASDRQARNDYIEKLIESVGEYSSGTVHNSAIRNADVTDIRDMTPEAFATHVNQIDEAIASQTPIAKPITAYRGLSSFDDATEAYVQQLRQLRPGDTFNDLGFVSLTKNETAAEPFTDFGAEGSIMMEVRIPSGSQALDVEAFMGYGGESELLLPRDTTFRVVSNDGRRMVVEVMPSGTLRSPYQLPNSPR